MTKKKYLIVVLGPTAVGKTDLSLHLAQDLSTEIISADSRQFYREMQIGTAKPTPDELAQVKHHLVNSHSIQEDYSVGQYELDAIQIISDLHQQNDYVLLVGGSGLYIQAVCEGMDAMPAVDPQLREALIQKKDQEGVAALLEQLQSLDPIYYETVDKANPQRVIRALEVSLATGKPYSSFRQKKEVKRDFESIKIGLNRPREELYQRINQRMDQMIAAGLFEEAKLLYPYKEQNALQTVGYQEIFDYLEGKYDQEEAIRLLKRNSRRYAKRQLTWFRKDETIEWFAPEHYTAIKAYLEKKLGRTLPLH